MKDVKNLVSQMTLEEKVSLCSGLNMWELKGIERLGIPSIMVANGPHGLQKQAEDADFVGISNSIPATCFPPAVTQAATWNRELIYQLGEALGAECRQEKVGVLLGPGINIKRSPLGGRNYDYYSEDPYLSGEMAKQHILGVQSQGVGTSLKHFAVSNQEFRRMTINVVVDERALREIYLAGFENIVKEAQPWTVMNAYHLLNDAYCSENAYIINDILKKEWGFEGLVVSDWGSVNDRVAGLKAGVDLEMPGPAKDNEAAILAALASGELAETAVTQAVERILPIIFKAAETLSQDVTYDKQAHHDLARRVAEEGTVLLKNEGDTLPISENAKIALIGRIAKTPRFQGGGSSLTNPTMVDNLFDEMVKRVGEDNLSYAPGYPESDKAPVDETLLAEALQAAQEADVVIVMVGTKESEGGDHKDMKLPATHNTLVASLAAVHKKVVVLLSNGAPVEMPWCEAVPAVVEGYLGGQAGAGAQADILLGKVNPSGKLGESFPIKLEDNPSFPYFTGGPATVEYRESIYVGYRYYDTAKQAVRFPFGHGLSYTTFTYRDLVVTQQQDGATVTLKVKNTGNVAGKEIVQVYVHDVASTVFRPEKELKGFAKVDLLPGEEQEVRVVLNGRSFAFYDVTQKEWVIEAGEFDILVGSSGQDIRLTETIHLLSGQEASPVDKGKLTPYYQLTKGMPVSQDVFAALNGRSLPANVQPQKGSYTLNTPIGDMQDSFIGRMLFKMMKSQVHKMFANGEEENPLLDMIDNMLLEMPLRSMGMMSDGAVSRGALNGLLLMINGKFFKGSATLLKNIINK